MSGWNVVAWYSIFAGAALKSTALLALAWLAVRLLRGRSAAARHLVWTAALAAVLALPFLSISLPALRVRVAAALWPGQPDAVFQASAAAASDAGAAAYAVHGGAMAALTGAQRHIDWRIWMMLIWAAGFTAAVARTLLAYAAAWRLRRSARPFADSAPGGAMPRVLETTAGTMPMTCGVLRPSILFPADAVEWAAERRRIVLLHELAHVQRGDPATHLLARAALNIYWWNPLAWMAWREFLKERERAADDLVLSAGARASEYAAHLLEVARTLQSAPAMGWAAVAMARRSQLEGRLLAILDPGVNRAAAGRASVAVAVLLAVALVAPLAAVRAQENQTHTASADLEAVDAAIKAAHAQKNYQRLENAAQAAAQLRMYDTAHKLLESALAIRGEIFGGASVECGVGFLKLAALDEKQQHTESAERLYAKAAQILGDHPEAGLALTHLGVAAIGKKHFSQAMDYFQHARRADPVHAGTSVMWMAIAEQREEHMDEAEKLYQSALAVQDPKSVEAAVTMEVYGQFLRKLGRGAQAGELDARAADIQILAPPAKMHPATDVPPSVLEKVEPDYSDEGRAAGLQGTVVLQVVIGLDGVAHDVRVLKGLGLGLDEQAIDAVGQWRFKPGIKDGRPVAVTATIEVNWRLL